MAKVCGCVASRISGAAAMTDTDNLRNQIERAKTLRRLDDQRDGAK
jgi:hypothetical protein